jgi:hypothetical protein
MASGEVFDAIKAYMSANWTANQIRWENEPLDPLPEEFTDVEMTGTYYGQESIGASRQEDNRWDEEGVLWLHTLVKINTGGSTAHARAKALADMFRGTRLLNESLEFREAFIGRGQPGFEDGMYYRLSTYINWRRMDA